MSWEFDSDRLRKVDASQKSFVPLKADGFLVAVLFVKTINADSRKKMKRTTTPAMNNIARSVE